MAKSPHVTFCTPPKSATPPVVTYAHRPIPRLALEPPRHCCPPPPTAEDDTEGLVHALLRVTLKLVVFHWVNSMLGAVAFTAVAAGTLLSILLTPLCCLGIAVFRLVLCIVAALAELDVALVNFVSLPEEHISVSKAHDSRANAHACGETSVERVTPDLTRLSQPAMRATLYFLSAKALIGMLSSLVLSIAFSLPVGAISRGSLGDNFHGVVGLLVFLLATVLLLMIGIPLMQYGARLSRAATVYFCCEKFTPVHHHHEQSSYGTTDLYTPGVENV